MRSRHCLILGLITLTFGCGHDGMSMAEHAGDLDQHLDEYADELDAHRGRVLASVDLVAILAEEDSHGEQMQPHEVAMMHDMGDMMGCLGPDGEGPDMGAMFEEMTGMKAERDAHRTHMLEAASLDAALDEEERHRGEMSSRMTTLREHMGPAMDDSAGDLECSHHR